MHPPTPTVKLLPEGTTSSPSYPGKPLQDHRPWRVHSLLDFLPGWEAPSPFPKQLPNGYIQWGQQPEASLHPQGLCVYLQENTPGDKSNH